MCLPFYPGKRKPSFPLQIDPTPENRRCNGHLGRFDYTVSPQLPEFIWPPFIMRTLPKHTTVKQTIVKQYPEFATVHSAWIGYSHPASFTETLAPRFLCRRNDFLYVKIQT
ncbi:hypothetical protein L208DRAFT_1390861 [Tricholoma matsutake]|nr:hypothetical protein L208DRAFT_1390861 [Tricholoma matsutake 945]